MSTKRMHWAGGVRTVATEFLAGWPCCCSGWLAELAVERGSLTRDPARVTCRRCLATMRKHVHGDLFRAPAASGGGEG